MSCDDRRAENRSHSVFHLRRFRIFWLGDTISAAGGSLSTLAIPLLALQTLGASGAVVGAVKAAQTLPFLILAIPVGLLVDRVSRRGLLLAADALRVPLVATVALTALAGVLTVPGLITLVLLTGIGTVVYEVTYLSVLPQLVDGPARLPAANRAVETAHASASLLGPGVGGVLVGALSAAGVVALDAVSFAVGATLTAINRWPSPPAVPAGPGSPRAGWTWLRHDRYVRPMTLYLGVNNVAAQAFQTALLLFVVRTLGLPAAAAGLAVAATGAGFLAGAAVSPAAARRFGAGRVMIGAALIGALGMGVVALPGGLPVVLAGAVLSGAGPGLLNLHSIAIRQAVTPPGLLGRVTAVVKTVSYGSTTVGALAGGALSTAFGPRTVIVVSALCAAPAVLLLACSAIRRLRGLSTIAP
jgi:MFS family permease